MQIYKFLKRMYVALQQMAHHPNATRRGIHRSGIVIGSIFSICIGLCSIGFLGYLLLNPSEMRVDDLITCAVCFSIAFLAFGIPVFLAKALGWVIEGFQKSQYLDKDNKV